MSLVESVVKKYSFPFSPLEYQVDEVNRLAEGCSSNAGYYWGMGAGKTFGSTIHSCIRYEEVGAQTILVCPPILLRQWSKWLTKCGISNKIYAGSPKQRSEITLDPNTRYFLMSPQIMRTPKDFVRLYETFEKRDYDVVVDEATSVKNVESKIYRAVKQMVYPIRNRARGVQLLTGTPLTTPADAYAYIDLISPGLYRSKTQFDNIHVNARDFYDRPIEWNKLDLLRDNLSLRGSFVSTAEVRPDMPRAHIQDIEYDLDKHHKALYKQLIDMQLLVYENGAIIDATTPQKLYQATQQIIINYGHFAQDQSLVPQAFEYIDGYLEELGKDKVIFFAEYRMSVKSIVAHLKDKGYKVGQINGDTSGADRNKYVDGFMEPDGIQVLVMNPESGGYGVDGLQNVCNRMVFLEIPKTPKQFWQGVTRLERPGQKFVTDVRVLTALGTVQVHLRKQLGERNDLIRQIVPTTAELRAHLMGK